MLDQCRLKFDSRLLVQTTKTEFNGRHGSSHVNLHNNRTFSVRWTIMNIFLKSNYSLCCLQSYRPRLSLAETVYSLDCFSKPYFCPRSFRCYTHARVRTDARTHTHTHTISNVPLRHKFVWRRSILVAVPASHAPLPVPSPLTLWPWSWTFTV